MADSSDAPFWMKALAWLRSLAEAAAKKSAIARDARLKNYGMTLEWKEDTRDVEIVFNVIAESETQARQLANAHAAKEKPAFHSLLLNRQVIPPYIKDPAAALSQWKVAEAPLIDEQRELAKKGQLGPPHAEGFQFRM